MARITIDETKPKVTPEPISGEIIPEAVAPETDNIDPELQTKSNNSLLSAFLAFPAGISFGEAEEGEKIILLLRAHWATTFPWLLISLALLLAPLLIFPLLSAVGFSGLSVGTGLVVVLFWYAGTFTYSFLNFLYWYFNVYIVTDERIVDTDWYSVVVRKISSMQLTKVQDVSATQAGVLSGMFDYGDVEIQTAAEEENFEFLGVPHPQLVAKEINELIEKEEKEEGKL